ncbi:MAG: ASCH domain-containing protein [Patescibacteria group bacterium]
MKLQPGPFAAIKAGTKSIESRLYDEKRQRLQLGDEITFRNMADLNEAVTVKVIELLKYPTFSGLFAAFPPSEFGGESSQALEDRIYSVYSKADEAKFGVLGIRIEMMD